MNILLKFLLAITILGISTAYFLEDDSSDDELPGYSDDSSDDLLAVYKKAVTNIARSRNLCIPWRSPCTLDDVLIAKYSFLRCCNDGACKCNFWGNNCRCEATLGG